jgi:hypothetical protein
MPVYSPGTNDIVNGTARLKLTAFGQNGSTLHSTTLAIGGIPVAGIVVSPKDTVCATQTLSLSVPAQPGTTYLWMPGGFTSPTITLDTTITGGLGNRLFKVKAINLFHCSAQDSVSVTFQDCTGINEAQGSFSLTIYPNPSTGAFTLSIYAPHPEKVDIQVLNELNVSCYEENGLRVSGLTSKDFLLNDLPAGIYFLVLKRDEGKITRRLAITR